MAARARVFSVLVVIIVAASVPASAQQWIEVHSPNFSIVTNGNVNEARDVLNRFEQMRAVFGSLFRRTKVNIPIPLQIVAFRSHSEMTKGYAPLFNGKPVDVAGYYQPGEDRNFIMLDLSQEESWTTAFHEYAHLLLNSNYPRTALWFDEGFAEYYSTMKVNKKEVEIGYAPSSYSMMKETSSLMPLVQLFSIEHDSKTYNQNGRDRQMLYTQSWIVVHWIFDNQKLPELAHYFDLTLRRKVPISDAMRQAFGMEAKQFDKVIYDYWNQGRGNILRVPAPARVEPNTFALTRLSETQAQAHLADLKAHMQDHRAEGIAMFKQVLEKDPDNEIAHRGLGFAYLMNHEMDLAADHLQRAAKLNANDARVHYYAAVLMNRGSQTQVENEGRAQQMAFELQQAIKLDPEYADAYHMLSFAYLSANKPDEALTAMLRAVELSPRNEMFQIDLAQVHMMNNKYKDARGILEALQSSPEPTIASRATQLLETMEMRERQATRIGEGSSGAYKDVTDPRWAPKEREPLPPTEAEETEQAKPDLRKIEFLKGTLTSVDCASEPSAVLTVSAGAKQWKFKAADRAKLVLIGADTFSCGWKNVKVAVNYKLISANQGDLVSLEVQ